ncbi:MAG: hypothetical protein NZ534_10220, partial [Bacteroidia bacterium]|nr:hypothetical protein [Bacteroidia bacterium]
MSQKYIGGKALWMAALAFALSGAATARNGDPDFYYLGSERAKLIPNYERVAVGVSDVATVGRLRARWAQYPEARPIS